MSAARFSIFFAIATCLLACRVAQAADPAELARAYDADIQRLVKQFCIKCHNGETMEGALNLAELDTGSRAVEALAWPELIDRLLTNEMPPEDAPQPNDRQRLDMVGWMQKVIALDDGNCDKLASDVTTNYYRGSVTSRRLTRAEYNHSIRDLVGLDLNPADAFPADGSGGEGFDTVGDTLFTSAIFLEKSIEAARRVLATALPDVPAEGLSPQLAAIRHRLLPHEPTPEMAAPAAARACLAEFARRAYRRPITDDDLASPLKLFEKAHARGDSFTAAMRLALAGVLSSPNFLFLAEPLPAESGVHPLAGSPLAARLAYFLWSSTPDDELLALGESGEIANEEVLIAQTRRMLADPRAADMAANFTAQWLGLNGLGTSLELDAEKFPEFDESLAHGMKQEILQFSHAIFSQDRSLLEFIDADYTFVNDRLAQLYGLELSAEHATPADGAAGAANPLRRVQLADRNRGGLIGMAGIHAITSHPRRTSPVLRGKWVMADLLGNTVAPPPPDVPPLPADDSPEQVLTLRQQLERHRENAQCASCHDKLDPLGFALENFDPLGRWRTELGGLPIDTRGQLPSGESVSSPAELKQVLLNRKDEFLRNLTKKMLCFALGRELNRFDECIVRKTLEALRENDYRSSVLFEQIVLSYPFRHRYIKK